ncbi:4Fe-4S dicluster domain-containing protein [Desulfospira joergensenii]|uniref:4Fe-4S dicluster domain-containing protein n=1 Tax=Desulfospira joergensenii TaxID=53329 RepID=UPI0003B30CA3|nr:4Fe-4S dicluster domain-containing protein [Desulfospira joergensenii]
MMTEEEIPIKGKTYDFSDAVKAADGIEVSWCYQCGKCAGGCPLACEMDLTPTQLIHAVQLGLKDLVHNSKTMWLCSSCQTCTTRCPQNVDVAGVMAAVKVVMQQENAEAKVPAVLAFNQRFLENIKLFGRTYELGMVALYKLKTLSFTQDLGLGVEMLKRGKFKILPRFVGSWSVRKIFMRARRQEKI